MCFVGYRREWRECFIQLGSKITPEVSPSARRPPYRHPPRRKPAWRPSRTRARKARADGRCLTRRDGCEKHYGLSERDGARPPAPICRRRCVTRGQFRAAVSHRIASLLLHTTQVTVHIPSLPSPSLPSPPPSFGSSLTVTDRDVETFLVQQFIRRDRHAW